MKRSRVIMTWLGLPLLVFVFGVLALTALLQGTERAVEIAAVGGDSKAKTVLERFPPTGPDETAQALQAVAVPLGLSLLRESDVTAYPTAEASETAKAYGEQAKLYLRKLRIAERHLDTLVPPTLAMYLQEHDGAIREVSRLLKERVPRWGVDLSAGSLVEIPDYQGLIGLSRLLIMAARVAEDEGRFQQADQHLEAAWNLAISVGEGPLLIDQLIYHGALSNLQGHLRHSDRPSDPWLRRLRTLDLRQDTLDAFHLETWLSAQTARNGDLMKAASWPWSTRPGKFLSALPVVRTQHAAAKDIASEDPRSFDVDTFVEARVHRPTWPYTRSVLVHLAGTPLHTWPEANRMQLALELTGYVLEARQTLCQDSAVRAERLPSAAIPDLRWIVESSAAPTIRLSEEFPTDRKAPLALQFEISPEACPPQPERMAGL